MDEKIKLCKKCSLPKDCEGYSVPSGVELGQLVFSPNYIQQYDCPNWVIALLRDIEYRLNITMWNINQVEYDSPFANTGNSYIGKNFEVHAYHWDNEEEQPYNFKCGNIEISWYKYLGRGTTINGKYYSEEILKMYEVCIKEIQELEARILNEDF